MSREKVAIVAGDAPLLISQPFLQRTGTVLNLEQGQVTFNKLGVTLNLEESATGHNVIDLISGCADSSTDESTREIQAALENVLGTIWERFRGRSR